MLVCLLLYAYCVGVFSRRKSAQACERHLACIALVGQERPDFRTISDLRTLHLEAFKDMCVQVRRVAGEAGMVQLGNIATDGPKIPGNASRHQAMSYGYMRKEADRLREDIEVWVTQAHQQDAEDEAALGSRRGDELPAERARREDRMATIEAAMRRLEARAKAPADEERQRRAAAEAARQRTGQKRRGKAPKEVDATPEDKAQMSFTNPELGSCRPTTKAGTIVAMPKPASMNGQNLKKIFAALHTDSQAERRQVLGRLREIAFLRAVNAATNESAFKTPGVLYARSPELACYFEGNCDTWFLDEKEAIPEDILVALGIARAVRVRRRNRDAHGYVHLETLREGSRRYYKRGVDGFDPLVHIDGLGHALTYKPSREKAAFIWNRLLLSNTDCLHGTIESCSRQTFVGAKRESQRSEVGVLVTEEAWLPHPTGGFGKPQELSLDDLPHEFNKYETLAKLLDMRSSSITMLAQGLGIDPALIDYFQKNKEALCDFEEFKKWREDRGKPKNRSTSHVTRNGADNR